MSKKNQQKNSSHLRDTEMSLVEHLLELRGRLLWSLGLFAVAFIAIYPNANHVFSWLVTPLADLLADEAGRRLIYTGLPEAFLTYIKITLFSAFVLSFPIFAYHLWRFIAPGFYKEERKAFLLFLLATPMLFLLGAGFAFYGVIPAAWKFFLSYESTAVTTGLPIQLEARVSEYLSMTLQMIIAFGLCFQLPLVLLLLSKLGVIKVSSLREKRRYAIVGILIAAAVLTPPDVVSMMGLAVPLYVLYEISIFLVKLRETKYR